MRLRIFKLAGLIFLFVLPHACGIPAGTTAAPSRPSSVVTTSSAASPTAIPLPSVSITLGTTNQSNGISLDSGGDVDTKVVSVGTPATEARESGDNQILPGGDSIPDSYLQFNVDDNQLFGGKPTAHVRLEVEYFDQGRDTFSIQYDALAGRFAGGGSVVKTDSQTFKTAAFNLCDANFANRDNGADFRVSDNGDGAEIVRSVRLTGLPSSAGNRINVDDFGANPFDDQPDSDAIQAALDSTCSGDTIVFTSGVDQPGYQGYQIDKTLFLTGASAKHDLTFTSSDPMNHALLKATADLKGYVVRLFARSRFSDAGDIDNIDFGTIDVNGSRDLRTCLGPDQIENGQGDNWGSWLPECDTASDPWCAPGNIGMDGAVDSQDVTQNYQANPDLWTTGLRVHDLVDSQGECGSALAFGGAAGTIQNVTIDTAGDHVHAAGCSFTDADGDQTGWSDGITLFGPAQTVTGNTIIDPSDVGIVYFGGKDTVISGNTVDITAGNHGAFAGIALHPWQFGDVSGVQILGNQIVSNGDSKCGGLHAGINIGAQMWGGACVNSSTGAMYGNNGSCSTNPAQTQVSACTGGKCQLWAYLPAGATLTMQDNTVSGAQINYLIDGFDILGTFVDQNNISESPQVSDWDAARRGCRGLAWAALDKVAHAPSLNSYTDLSIQCER